MNITAETEFVVAWSVVKGDLITIHHDALPAPLTVEVAELLATESNAHVAFMTTDGRKVMMLAGASVEKFLDLSLDSL